MFDIEPGLIIWEIVTFTFLSFVLRLYVWRPLTEALKRREEGIREAMEQAGEARAQAVKLLEEARTGLINTEPRFQAILREAKERTDMLNRAVGEEAQKKAEIILAQNVESIQRHKDRAIQSLQQEIGLLVVQGAELIIDQTLTKTKHQQLITRIIDSMLVDGQSSVPIGTGVKDSVNAERE